MIRKNIYSRITESIIKAHHDHNLDSAMEDDGSENMGKKIVAIITADPDQDLDWDSEYEPFGATELTANDEQEAMEHEGMESDHELCPSCGYDVDCEGDECEDDDENDDMEDLMIGGEVEDDYEDMDVKDILVDILHELKGEDSETDEEGTFETSDENPMFGSSDDSEDEDEDDDDDDDDDEDYDSMLGDNGSSEWETSEDEDDDDDSDGEDDYDEEEDAEMPSFDNQEVDEKIFQDKTQEQEEDEVYTWDAFDNA